MPGLMLRKLQDMGIINRGDHVTSNSYSLRRKKPRAIGLGVTSKIRPPIFMFVVDFTYIYNFSCL